MNTNAIKNVPDEQKFMRVEDVTAMLGCGTSKAYQIMRQLNKELEQQGKITVAGRVSRKYFIERCCY
ncbi:MAG: DNA-binding protein [Lachnospiraceae bacterium]|nr:DNA-binding protein [Lachnospiraceae bacterium]